MKRTCNPRAWRGGQWIAGLTLLAGIVAVVWLMPVRVSSAAGGNPADGRYVYADLAEQVIPSVVTVYVKKDLKLGMSEEDRRQFEQFRRFFENPQLRRFFGPNVPIPESQPDEDPLIAKGAGSGVIVSEDGYIVTNWHVVGNKKDQAEIRVVFSDNSELSGKDVELVASTWLIDMALLKVNRRGLKPVRFGDSDRLRIGERVAAIGSPLDLRLTVTQGIVCAKHRELGQGIIDMLQTDAVINPGSSGGALVNLDGELIGINRMISTPTASGRWEGYGFAIPSNDVKRFVDQVRETGEIAFGYIGVMMAQDSENTPKMREALGFDRDRKGVLVMEAVPGTPAGDAGLRQGDMIVEANGEPIEDNGDLLGFVARQPIGSSIRLRILRPTEGGKPQENVFRVQVAKRDEEKIMEMRGPEEKREEEKPVPTPNDLGLRLEPIREGDLQGLKVLDVAPDSPALRAGIQPDDVLTRLNFVPLKTMADLDMAIGARKGDKPHVLYFTRKGRSMMTLIEN